MAGLGFVCWAWTRSELPLVLCDVGAGLPQAECGPRQLGLHCCVSMEANASCTMCSCSSRTKNMMWYGVLGTKELVQKTYKNLEQRVQLEVRPRQALWGGEEPCALASPWLCVPPV